MTEPIIRLMLVVRDLLGLDESKIHRGRTGAEWEYSTDLNVAVDSLAPASTTSKSEFYDGETEELKLQTWHRQTFTVSFFGADAYEWANKLHHLLSTDQAKHAQFEHKIAVSHAKDITDVKALTQHHYINRFDVTLIANFSTELVIQTGFIEKANIDIQTETQEESING